MSMPKVASFEIPGLTCWFWSHDHEPPHFHVKRDGEWEIRVRFLEDASEMFELVWGGAPKAKVLKDLARLAADHRIQLLAQWEASVSE
jgi:hypothetical protein